MLKSLKILIGISIAASLCTLFTTSRAPGELYPFTSWKLFTQPIGSKDTTKLVHLYGLGVQGNWQLLPIKATSQYDYDDTYYLFKELCQQVDTTQALKYQLRKLALEMYPHYKVFALKQKSLRISSFVKDTSQYQEKTICSF